MQTWPWKAYIFNSSINYNLHRMDFLRNQPANTRIYLIKGEDLTNNNGWLMKLPTKHQNFTNTTNTQEHSQTKKGI